MALKKKPKLSTLDQEETGGGGSNFDSCVCVGVWVCIANRLVTPRAEGTQPTTHSK